MKVDSLLIFPHQLLIQVIYATSLYRFECEVTLWKYAIVDCFQCWNLLIMCVQY